MEESENVNFVSCVKWIQKGAANTNPSKVQLSKQELVDLIKDTKAQLSVNDNVDTVVGENSSRDEFNFDCYDNDDDEKATAEVLGISALAELGTENENDNFSESDDSDKEDELIKNTDNLILVGHVEGDASILEVYVYNEIEESLYVHHDILLSAFPLCLEWLNYEPNMPKGNYCAVGSMLPIIDIWDIDIINQIEPSFKLGQPASRKKNRPHIGHTDAVLALAWNKTFDHIMASGSVDTTILLWDMEQKRPSTTISAFNEKVQCLEWHKLEPQTLLAGGCDGNAKVFDCRSPEPHQTWTLQGEAERLIWSPLQPFMFIAGTSEGMLQGFDCRKGLLWSVKGHDKEVTGLAISNQCPRLMITASPDETMKTWDLLGENEPTLVHEKEFSIGNLHCLELCPDLPFVVTAGGDKKSNNFVVYDLQNIDVVKHTFENREPVQLVTENITEDNINS